MRLYLVISYHQKNHFHCCNMLCYASRLEPSTESDQVNLNSKKETPCSKPNNFEVTVAKYTGLNHQYDSLRL